MVRRLLVTNLSFPISDGVNHCIPPFQYSFLSVSGVPPPTTLATSPKMHLSHSPVNPGNLRDGAKKQDFL